MQPNQITANSTPWSCNSIKSNYNKVKEKRQLTQSNQIKLWQIQFLRVHCNSKQSNQITTNLTP